MTEAQMRQLAEREEFDKVAILSVDDLVVHQDYRVYCEENSCGNYNRNYGCPPDCGTPQEMEDKLRRWSRVLIMQTRMEMDDVEDKELLQEIRKEHNRKSRLVADRIREDNVPGLLALPGPCSWCKVCQKLKGNPCPFPEKQTSCLSAYGIDVTCLAESCGMRLDWDGGSISYFALFLF